MFFDLAVAPKVQPSPTPVLEFEPKANMAHITNPAANPSKTLPADGMSRWNQIAPFSPFCREKFRQLVRAGKAPQPVKFSERCTAYPNRELHRFFADPLNYKVEVAK